jgi:hypothetical protein
VREAADEPIPPGQPRKFVGRRSGYRGTPRVLSEERMV